MEHERSTGTESKENIDENIGIDELFPLAVTRAHNRKLASAIKISQESQNFRPFGSVPQDEGQ